MQLLLVDLNRIDSVYDIQALQLNEQGEDERGMAIECGNRQPIESTIP